MPITETLERGHAHRGLHRSAAVDRGDRGSVAEVEDDLLQLVQRAAEEGRRLLGDILVAGAVESISADAVPLGDRAVDRIGIGGRRQRLVKSSVEDRHVRHVGEHSAPRADAGHCAGVVQRREHRQVFDVDLDEIVDERRREEPGTAVDDTMPDGDRRMLGQLRPVLGELLEHHGHRLVMIGDLLLRAVRGIEHRRGRFAFGTDAANGVGDLAGVLTDPFDEALAERHLTLHIHEAVLQRRRTAVDDEDDAHGASSRLWVVERAQRDETR